MPGRDVAWRGAILIGVSVAVAGTVLAQQVTLPDVQPVFRATVSLVQVDATVLDRHGNSVTDLRPEEFRLTQDGVEQALRDVRYVASGTGAHQQRRTLVLIVDDANLRAESALRLRHVLPTIVRAAWQDGDSGMVARTAPGADVWAETSTDVTALEREIERINTSGPFGRPARHQWDCRLGLSDEPLEGALAGGTFLPLQQVLSAGILEGTRPVVLLFADAVSDFRCPGARASADERLRRLADRAGRQNAVVFGIHPSGRSSGVVMPETRGPDADAARAVPGAPVAITGVSQWLRTLSERTGGFTVRANDIEASVGQALRQSAGYYLLTYEPPAGTFAGRKTTYRTLGITVTRPGIRVWGRSGFYATEAGRE